MKRKIPRGKGKATVSKKGLTMPRKSSVKKKGLVGRKGEKGGNKGGTASGWWAETGPLLNGGGKTPERGGGGARLGLGEGGEGCSKEKS